ncbi:hypothetical protein VNO78_18159 [Psophocarpus tetragonolobus]|uniref:Uncharacterized protein n=1 Tax=Psophocarpus tetragonolobus TaxID=3891 RepID=A0AAN9SIU3_PSOTE
MPNPDACDIATSGVQNQSRGFQGQKLRLEKTLDGLRDGVSARDGALVQYVWWGSGGRVVGEALGYLKV